MFNFFFQIYFLNIRGEKKTSIIKEINETNKNKITYEQKN